MNEVREAIRVTLDDYLETALTEEGGDEIDTDALADNIVAALRRLGPAALRKLVDAAYGSCGRARSTGKPCPDHPRPAAEQPAAVSTDRVPEELYRWRVHAIVSGPRFRRPVSHRQDVWSETPEQAYEKVAVSVRQQLGASTEIVSRSAERLTEDVWRQQDEYLGTD